MARTLHFYLYFYPMILIADSGASKIDWRLLKKDGSITQANSPGFNPYYQPIDHLKRIITEVLHPKATEPVTKVYYYGTGVSSDKNQKLVQDAFFKYFPTAQVEVGWDLLAAARALCGREPGIACILGTGSNTCSYDGERIIDNVANLGWILADEGSGADLGKKTVVDYFRQSMPGHVAELFKTVFPWTREELLEKVYQQEKPSAFLASFSKFIGDHIHEPYCHQLVHDRFNAFFENNVVKYPDFQQVKVHFTGSIAFHFSNILRQVAKERGITVQHILESPIAGLTLYHQKDLN
jgi:N-acetylglucosamine kinase-like BadF-type ATPase